MTFEELFPELARWEVINYLIKTFEYKSYLEIGLHTGKCFNKVECELKESVDINFNPTYKMRSSTFFKEHSDHRYDIIFIDADHGRSSVLGDVNGSLGILNDGGTIVCHDVNPLTEKHLDSLLCYNAWEAFAELRTTRTDLEVHTIPIDHLGIIRRGTQELFLSKWERTWTFLNAHRKSLMGQIEPEEFLAIYSK